MTQPPETLEPIDLDRPATGPATGRAVTTVRCSRCAT